MTDTSQITDHPEDSKLEYTADGHRAELRYRLRGNRLVIVHTAVPPELEGHGIGGTLVAAALARAAQQDLTVVPLCPFARQWLQRHPDAAAAVTIDWGADGQQG